MAKSYRPWDPTQSFLLPPSPLEWLREGHLAYFVLDVVGELDLSSIERAVQAKDPRGERPYDPRMMTALLVYGYAVGVASSRKIERATDEDVAFRVIAAGARPDHTRISEFRRTHLAALAGLFVQVLRLCQAAGLVKLGHVALDGTKVKANASKHKAMSYDRMQRSERELRAEVDRLLAEAEQADRDEDARFGPARRGDELPEELSRRESRLARIREAKRQLEAEASATRARELSERAQHDDGSPAIQERRKKQARAAAQQAEEKAEAADKPTPDLAPRDPDALPSHQVEATAEGEPAPKAQRNFTDPESQIMKGSDGFVQAYNCQAAVDEAHQIIVAQAVTNQPPDVEHLRPMVNRIVQDCGAPPRTLTADAGYWSESNAAWCGSEGVDAYIATGRSKHGAAPALARGRPPKGLDARGWMQRKLTTKRGRAVYARRKAVVEPVFGQVKQARGFRQFLLRGLAKVQGEWALISLGHNLRKLALATG